VLAKELYKILSLRKLGKTVKEIIMAMKPQFGSFVPTTNVWDVSQIYSTEVTSPEFKELLVRLYQNLNFMSINTNLKDIGYYDTNEQVNGQQFFPNPATSSVSPVNDNFRSVFRKTINFGALPNTTTKSVAHGIDVTDTMTFTRIYGTASDLSARSYIPLPYASNVANSSIELYVDATNVTIATAADWTSYTVTYIVLEYLKG